MDFLPIDTDIDVDVLRTPGSPNGSSHGELAVGEGLASLLHRRLNVELDAIALTSLESKVSALPVPVRCWFRVVDFPSEGALVQLVGCFRFP